eukprot:TRINITY_DN3992_c0_g1_i4.p1 TRINITY_DN3992_c0_g1~~TRINITY_DN3992_c0_g1_i4.p1  ORF type:complete len:461 (+),score=66.08 TRINITY_DN3992_c0_g1_i4:61-1383(+)
MCIRDRYQRRVHGEFFKKKLLMIADRSDFLNSFFDFDQLEYGLRQKMSTERKRVYKFFSDVDVSLKEMILMKENTSVLSPLDYVFLGSYLQFRQSTSSSDISEALKQVEYLRILERQRVLQTKQKVYIYMEMLTDKRLKLEPYLNSFLLNPTDASLHRYSEEEEKKMSDEVIANIRREEEQERQRKALEKDRQQNQNLNCSICLDNLLEQDVWPLKVCGHVFHVNCFSEYLKSEINARKFPLQCPGEGCRREVMPEDIYEVLDPEYIEKYETFSTKMLLDTNPHEYSCCPTAGCENVFIYKEGDYPSGRFDCESCHRSYCLNCKVSYHHGKSCGEYKAEIINSSHLPVDDMFVQFVQGAKYKQCPRCRMWVEKNGGCNHMTCRCRFEFCYVCGSENWGACNHPNVPEGPIIRPVPFQMGIRPPNPHGHGRPSRPPPRPRP